jgi:hypothetical protein
VVCARALPIPGVVPATYVFEKIYMIFPTLHCIQLNLKMMITFLKIPQLCMDGALFFF